MSLLLGNAIYFSIYKVKITISILNEEIEMGWNEFFSIIVFEVKNICGLEMFLD